MSLVEGLASVLREMTLAELALALAALLAYSLAINASFGGSVRSGAASLAFAAAVGFATLATAWMSAVVFLALLVVGVAAFAGAAWTVSSLLGLGEHVPVALSAGSMADEFAGAPSSPQPARAFAPHTSAQPL